ncbi:inactive kinase SELMODRAFT_444075-like [Olea europaea subsp. europaea]|uniref:non-specific serine/threonine protein kinase n=1 Tax=Olea europaea subsp. europaea TaxID=158383 RepID=A0A8S0Q892_OLEEU|nr:inactive kinase SELMODRAFT_444075-like [Olea europaea subsp. europaea]
MMIEKMGAQKVVLISTSIDISWIAIKGVVMEGLSLDPGDELTFLGVIRWINPRHVPLLGAVKLLGFKGKGDSNMIFASNEGNMEEELSMKRDELQKNDGIMQLQKLCETEKKVKMNVEVEAGPSRKAVAVRGAKKLGATWIILDRELKKDKQYFMDRLSCGISSMKSNNTVVVVRGPIRKHVSYDEMIPTYSWEELSPSQQSKYVASRGPIREHGTFDENIPSYLRDKYSKSPATQKASSFKEQAHNRCSRHFPDNSKVLASTAGIIETRQSAVDIQEIENIMTTKQVAEENSNGRTLKYKGQNEVCSIKYIKREKKKQNNGEGNETKTQTREEFESTCSVCRNKRPKLAMQREFTFEELYEATGGFSGENFLSEGGFGLVFKGVLENGLKIAVKQHKAASLQGEKEFKSEVHVLSQARHQNLVMLLGSCSKGSQRLLVYEYVCNGSLEELLSGDSKRPLNWEKRIKIALGAAKGLAYLHARNIVHRDMRPSNILITHDHESRLGDFGLAKAQEDDSITSVSGMVGTLGYMAPEYAEHGKMSTKTDVYSFGMVMLQLITGLRITDKIPEGKSLVGWAKPLLESKNYPDLIDKRIADSHDVHQLLWMVRVAESCLKKDPNVRCTMEQNEGSKYGPSFIYPCPFLDMKENSTLDLLY